MTKFFTLLFSACLLQLGHHAYAQGNLLVTPRRVVFEGDKKMQELNIANTGQDTATYLISMMEIRMREDGSFEKISTPDSGQNFASSYLRYFPRRVVLAPGEAQMVKVQALKSGELQPGEYRSHLYFRAVPKETPLKETGNADTADISVRLTPVFGLTIPVIIRAGGDSSHISLSDASLEQSGNTTGIRLAFRRSGNMSVYGDLKIEYISPQGQTILAGTVKGIAVYTPNTLRWFRMPLQTGAGIDYHTGKLRIVYEQQKNAHTEVIAETELALH